MYNAAARGVSVAKWSSRLTRAPKVVGSIPGRVLRFTSAFVSETPGVVAGTTEFVLCATLSTVRNGKRLSHMEYLKKNPCNEVDPVDF